MSKAIGSVVVDSMSVMKWLISGVCSSHGRHVNFILAATCGNKQRKGQKQDLARVERRGV